MKGNVTMELNEASMIDALQEWIDQRWIGEDVRVTSVKAEPGVSGVSPRFTISLCVQEEPDPDKVRVVKAV